MALAMPSPTIEQIINGLITPVIAAGANPGGFLYTTMNPFGATLDVTTVSGTETNTIDAMTKYKNVKFGSRANFPPGLALQFFPSNVKYEYVATPSEERSIIHIRIIGSWVDTPSNKLTADPDLVSRMMTTFAEAVRVVISPANLGTPGGVWTVPNSGSGVILTPYCEIGQPNAWATQPLEQRNEFVHYCSLNWRGWRETYNP